MSWTKLEEATYHPPRANKSTTLVTWRCQGCRALAVTSGSNPGACGKRTCRYYREQ